MPFFLRITILCCLITHLSWAKDPVVIQDKHLFYPIDTHCDMLFANIAASEVPTHWQEFKPFESKNILVGINKRSNHWFKFSVKNNTTQPIYLTIPSLKYAGTFLYEVKNNELILLEKGGFDLDINLKNIKNHQDIFPINLGTNEQKEYVLMINSFERKSFWAALGTDYTTFSESHKTDIFEGIMFGALLMVVIYQILIYSITKERDYLLLAIYLLGLFTQSLTMKGHLFEYLRLNYSNYRFYSWVIPTTSALSFMFSYYFLNLQESKNKIIKYAPLILFASYVLVIIMRGMGIGWVAFGIFWVSFIFAVWYIYMGFKRFNEGFKPAAYFLIAYFPACLSVVIRGFFIVGFLSYSWFTEESLLISYTIHGLLFSIAVAYKIKTYRDETELLMQEQRIGLEQKVAERTAELGREKTVIQEQSDKLKMVMKELHHRVKNNLTIVSSLLELQSHRLENENAIRAFHEGQQRIEAMSLIHQRLYKSDEITTISMDEYLHELIGNLMNAYGFTKDTLEIKVTVEYKNLDIDVAIPLGLILNELLTNSFKYAFPFTKNPILTINLLEKEGLLLEVKDNGKGIDMEDWKNRKGSFGKRLIIGLSEQLNGEYTINNENGTTFRLHIAEI